MSGRCHTMACVQQHANDFYAQLFTGFDHFARWLSAGQPAPPSTADIMNTLVPLLTLGFWLSAAVVVWGALGAWLCRSWLSALLPRIVLPGYGREAER